MDSTRPSPSSPAWMATPHLAAYNAHAVIRLLGDCAGKALDYYLRITPPSLSGPAAAIFGEMISTTRAGILQLTDHQDSKPLHTARLNANTLVSLPLHAGGLAHTDPETLTVYAYLSPRSKPRNMTICLARRCFNTLYATTRTMLIITTS